MSTVLLISAGRAGEWADALEGSGISLLVAKELTGGVKRLREGGIDLVVIDAQGDCDSLLELVDELDVLPDPPPFLLTSASSQAPTLSARLGAIGFLPQPCTSDEMMEALTRALPGPIVTAVEDSPTRPRINRLLTSL